MALNRCLVAVLGLLTIAGCSQGPGQYRTQDLEQTLAWDGLTRTYSVHAPAQIGPQVPLVLVLHGADSNGTEAARYTSMSTLADREGFIVVYPDGAPGRANSDRGRTWNAVHCCGKAYQNDIDDLGFLTALIEKMLATYPVDPKRIYVVGHSNGAMMAYKLAAEKSELIAAIAPISGTIGGDPDTSDADHTLKIVPNPEMPVAVAIFHGTADHVVPYQDQPGATFGDTRYDLSVNESSRFWSRANGCHPVAESESRPPVTIKRYGACNAQGEVWVYSLKDYRHMWNMASPILADKSSTDLIWEFLAAHPKP